MRRLATVVAFVLFIVFVMLSLLHCGGGSVCACPLGYVCVSVEKTKWKCEPSPMPPTWATSDGGVAVEEAPPQ